MDSFGTSLGVGLLLGILSVYLVNFINDRYTRQEKKVALLLLKRAKKN
jgi:NhaP-type Na+/H+ or K+/H+ antiporter